MNNTFREVAHNIQSPILILDSVVHTLESSDIYKDYIDDLKEAVVTIQSLATEMLANVRSDITDIDRVRQDKLERIKANKLIKAEISGKYIEYGKSFEIIFKDYNPEKPHFILVNEVKFKQILSNLLNNAHDALVDTDDKKEILIEISERENNIDLVVTNHGNIIPPDKINDVMNGVSTKHVGEGIGVSSAIKYLKTIQAKLLITSSEHDGTRVRLIFPKQ
jgi:C4-dicarboxylate-specific signal transduction histidine kinase